MKTSKVFLGILALIAVGPFLPPNKTSDRIESQAQAKLTSEAAHELGMPANSINVYGYKALHSNATGVKNNAYGYSALYSNATGIKKFPRKAHVQTDL